MYILQRYSLLFFTLIITAAIYLPGLTGLFLFDDEQNITQQKYLKINALTPAELFRAALSSDAGPLKRPISMLSFALNAYITGIDPYYFKLVNLIIHLINGILVYLISHFLFELYHRIHTIPPDYFAPPPNYLALFVSALWLLHPLNLTTVLYAVQRMTSLSSLFSFIGIALYLWGRKRQIIGLPGMLPILAAFFFAWPLAIFSKENGILLPALLMIIELTILNFQGVTGKIARSIVILFTLTVILPLIFGIFYLWLYPQWLITGYSFRPFTMMERLFTEARVLWIYLGLTVFPTLSRLGLYHDDIPLSTDWLEPSTTLWAIIAWIIGIASAILFRRRLPFMSFGVFFFLIGHSLESTFIPLEITHEHRNYLPVLGIFIAAIHYLFQPVNQPRLYRLQIILALSIISSFTLITSLRAALWGKPLEYMLTDVRYHPNSPRVNYEAGRFLVFMCIKETDPKTQKILCNQAQILFKNAYQQDPNFLISLIGILRIKDILGDIPTPEEIALLRNALMNRKLSNAIPSALTTLGQCILHGDCHLPLQLIDELYAAVLSNTTLQRNYAGILFHERGVIAYRLSNLTDAIQHTRIAFNMLPNNIAIGMNFIYLLIQAQQFTEAKKIIIQLRQLLNFWTDPIFIEQLNNYAHVLGE